MSINRSGNWGKSPVVFRTFLIFLFFSQSIFAEELPEFQGYYIKNGNEYVRAESFNSNRFGFDKLKNIESVERDDDSLYVHVYRENWDPVRSYFYTKPIAIINHERYDEQSPRVKSLGDDRYLLKFDDIGPENVLFIRDFTGNYAISLGDSQNELVKLFKNSEDSPLAVIPNLEAALESYPDNDELEDLLPKWEEARQNLLDEREWKVVSEEWNRYEKAGSIEEKLRYLKRTKAFAQNYLKSFPDAKYQAKAENYIETATRKLSL
ncbi:hypothetical protein C7H09_02070 [Marinobacter fuscus]|uniref:Uncharacterized protein n=1 Tax=Marinobacter fuscus TaxID=2109942 RepID=A0A2T1KTK9_9GAMM|nr:hypothetical protein [Marinobacter fuscus]PSF13420.1 hypothetical protein C7H09_02070 [Marinobacter fuscus]